MCHHFVFCSSNGHWCCVSVSRPVQGTRLHLLPVPVWDHAVRPDPRAARRAAEVLLAHRPALQHLQHGAAGMHGWAAPASLLALPGSYTSLCLQLCPHMDWSAWEKMRPWCVTAGTSYPYCNGIRERGNESCSVHPTEVSAVLFKLVLTESIQ